MPTRRPRRRIAIVTSIHPDFDGRIWKHVLSVAAAGWEVEVVAPWQAGNVAMPQGVRLHSFRRVVLRWQRPFLVPVRLGTTLLPLLHTCDLVHFHDIDILPWMAITSLWKPVVYDVHEDYPEEMRVRHWVPGFARGPLAAAVAVGQRMFSTPIRNIVTVCPEIAAAFPAPWYRTLVMANYASLKLADDATHDHASRPPTVVFTGSQHENNGSSLLLEIAARVGRQRPEVRFITVDRFADPAFRKVTLERIAELGLTNLELVPNVRPHELMTVLNRGTIGVSPNLRVTQQITGSHNKIYEYMAAALPIVASDLPRQIDVIGGCGCGILARPENPDSFVQAILDLTADGERGRRMGAAGQAAFREKYCWESQVPDLISLYDRITGGPAAAG
jgi:glycosyltransferase involved in cell wall biosynthesis